MLSCFNLSFPSVTSFVGTHLQLILLTLKAFDTHLLLMPLIFFKKFLIKVILSLNVFGHFYCPWRSDKRLESAANSVSELNISANKSSWFSTQRLRDYGLHVQAGWQSLFSRFRALRLDYRVWQRHAYSSSYARWLDPYFWQACKLTDLQVELSRSLFDLPKFDQYFHKRLRYGCSNA